MTEKLKNLMHERASQPEFASPDVDLLVTAGVRRRRRRRGLTVVAGAAAIAAIGGLAAISLGDDGEGNRVAVDPLPLRQVSWAQGSELHTPSASTDVGHDIRAYVRTAEGFVFADSDGTVWSFADASVLQVGLTDAKRPRLVSDPDGPLAGWVDTAGERPAFAVLDQGSNRVTTFDDHTRRDMNLLADQADPAYFYAIDDGVAYWRDDRGAVAVEVASGDVTVVDPDARNGFDIIDAESGQLAFTNNDESLSIGPTREQARHVSEAEAYFGSPGAFSPDGRYLSVDADEPQVIDLRTGRLLSFDLRGFATGYEWLDDRTLVMLSAEGEDDPPGLLTCDVAEGACEVAVSDLGTFEELADDFALPIGEPLGE